MSKSFVNKLIIFSAPSGSGKTTLVGHLLLHTFPLEFSISATNRSPRGTEKDGIEYYFLSTEEFKKKIDNGEFAEWEEVYPNRFYGTLKSEIDRIALKEKHVVFDIDVKGGIALKKLYGKRALSVFIKPPTLDCLRERLCYRNTDAPESIEQRIAKAEWELSHEKEFDKILINDDLETAKKEVIDLVTSFLENV
jgi:guanylate kinase